MDDHQARVLIDRLRGLYSEARDLEDILASLGIQTLQIVNPAHLDEHLAERLEEQQGLYRAFARLDFADDHYTFLRAIDGDTIVVQPPSQLRRWMKDIHVRLYGLETPELWEEMGPQYQEHLAELCAVDAKSRLMIVWERERLNTSYEGYPLASFERGIGHVFFHGAHQKYYYINGLMHVLKYSSLQRKGRLLLRGSSVIEGLNLDIPWRGPCATPLEAPEGECSSTFRQIGEMRPPVCLLAYPRLPTLDPREKSFGARVLEVIREGWQFGCPFEKELSRYSEAVLPNVVAQRASPFDVPLAEISMWAEARHSSRP